MSNTKCNTGNDDKAILGDVTDPDTDLDGICAMLEGLAYEPDTKANKRAKAKKRRTTKK